MWNSANCEKNQVYDKLLQQISANCNKQKFRKLKCLISILCDA